MQRPLSMEVAEAERAFKRKQRLSFFIIAAYLFLGGCEYAVIFPTAWEYLQTLGVTDEYWLGFTVSGYSFSAAIAGLIGGRLADVYINHTKEIVLGSIVIMTVGSFQYTLGWSVWNILLSRLLCGVGTAAGSAMLAEICRTTAIEERTPILAICNATRQMGILVGPVFQIVLSYAHFSIWGFEINPLNAPGVFMGILWVIFLILTMFMFYNLTFELAKVEAITHKELFPPTLAGRKRKFTLTDASGRRKSDGSVCNSGDFRNYGTITEEFPDDDDAFHHGLTVPGDDSVEVSVNGPASAAEAKRLATGGRSDRRRQVSVSERFFNSLAQSGRRQTAGEVDLIQASIKVETTYNRYVDEFLTDTFVMLLFMVFILFFCQIGVETVIPVIMQDYFGYGMYENSLVYMAGGLEALVVFFAVAVISRHVRDTTLQLVGWVLILAAQVWLLVVIPTFKTGGTRDMVYFMIGIVILYMGYPIASVANTGLYSKVLSNETQGLGQGLRRLSSYLGLIFGPAWAGSTVKQTYLYLGVPIAVTLFNGLMLAFSYPGLKRTENEIALATAEGRRPFTARKRAPQQEAADDEREALLRP